MNGLSVWKSLGFSHNPYDADPLKACQEDVDLLVGRQEEMMELCTVLDSQEHGAYIISGVPGVGKTSFFNITQFLLESSQFNFGPHLMCARSLCPIHPGDTHRDVAQRALRSLLGSVEKYCSLSSRPIPPETKKLIHWAEEAGSGGFQVGISIAGFGGTIGRSISLPKFSDTAFERILDALLCVVSEIVTVLNFSGTFIVLDNIENLDERHTADLLLSFRDTLFTCPNLWWVVIGQSGLGSLIQSIEPKVFERKAGVGLELKPLMLSQMHEAIGKRVKKFLSSGEGRAPLPEDVHKHLHRASHGEMRFVFKYSSDICTKFLSGVRHSVLTASKIASDEDINRRLGHLLVKHQIPADRAESVLKLIVREELEGLNLKGKEKEILALLYEKKGTRPAHFKDFGLKSMQEFSGTYLIKMHKQKLLMRAQEGQAVVYKLRGIAALAAEYNLLRI